MAGVVILKMDVLLELFGQAEMIDGVFGGEERSGEIVETIVDFDLKVRIGDHGFDEIALNIG